MGERLRSQTLFGIRDPMTASIFPYMRKLGLPLLFMVLTAIALAGCAVERGAEGPVKRPPKIIDIHFDYGGASVEPVKAALESNQCSELKNLCKEIAAIKSTPPSVGCTEIYGGDIRAVVHLDNETIVFSRENGCEIARWDEFEKALQKIGVTPPSSYRSGSP